MFAWLLSPWLVGGAQKDDVQRWGRNGGPRMTAQRRFGSDDLGVDDLEDEELWRFTDVHTQKNGFDLNRTSQVWCYVLLCPCHSYLLSLSSLRPYHCYLLS